MSEPAKLLLVFVGAGCGGVCRYLLDRVIPQEAFPWGTLAVNVTGCFAIGLLYPLLADREPWRLLLAVGLLGGYTTFSAFSRETVSLLQAGRPGAAAGYVLLSVVISLAATWAGMRLTGKPT